MPHIEFHPDTSSQQTIAYRTSTSPSGQSSPPPLKQFITYSRGFLMSKKGIKVPCYCLNNTGFNFASCNDSRYSCHVGLMDIDGSKIVVAYNFVCLEVHEASEKWVRGKYNKRNFHNPANEKFSIEEKLEPQELKTYTGEPDINEAHKRVLLQDVDYLESPPFQTLFKKDNGEIRTDDEVIELLYSLLQLEPTESR